MTPTVGILLYKPRVADVLVGILDVGDVVQQYRGAVAVGDDQIAVVRRLAGLIVGDHLVALIALIDIALGAVGIGRRNRGAHILQSDAVAAQLVGFELDAHRRQCAAAELDLAHAADLRQLLLDDGIGRIVELRRGQRARGQRQDDDGRIGRIVLAVGGIIAQRARQIGARRLDRRFHVARGAVDVAVQRELHHHSRGADVVARGQLGHARDGRQPRSSGSATVEAMMSGLAPAMFACTATTG